MHRLTIHNFGPIRDATVDIYRFLVLIGPQSSGKSTIAKLAHFCLLVRDEVMSYVVSCAQSVDPPRPEAHLTKQLRNRLVEFFGSSRPPADMRVTYDYGDECSLEISVDQKFFDFRFSPKARQRILSLVKRVRGQLAFDPLSPDFSTPVAKVSRDLKRGSLLDEIRRECQSIFSYHKELLFIPAGRTLLSTLSDQMQNVHPKLLDFPMRQFVDTVNQSRSYFNKSLDDLVQERLAYSLDQVDMAAVTEAKSYVQRILKGELVYDREGGKLYVSDNVYTKLAYASSGQQESVWILLSLFLLVLRQAKSLVVVEEPEAHLFPAAQKELLEYVAFVYNRLNCDFVLTTHSPYVLSCLNNLLYASDLGTRADRDKLEQIIPSRLWLNPAEVGGYFVDEGTVHPLMTTDPPVLKSELVDSASDMINATFSAMLELEPEAGASDVEL